MLQYIVRRLLMFIPMFFFLSLLSFTIIQLPPGNFLDTMIANMKSRGLAIDQAEIQRLNAQYGLDQPFIVQYTQWMGNFLFKGNLGMAFAENRPVADIL